MWRLNPDPSPTAELGFQTRWWLERQPFTYERLPPFLTQHCQHCSVLPLWGILCPFYRGENWNLPRLSNLPILCNWSRQSLVLYLQNLCSEPFIHVIREIWQWPAQAYTHFLSHVKVLWFFSISVCLLWSVHWAQLCVCWVGWALTKTKIHSLLPRGGKNN